MFNQRCLPAGMNLIVYIFSLFCLNFLGSNIIAKVKFYVLHRNILYSVLLHNLMFNFRLLADTQEKKNYKNKSPQNQSQRAYLKCFEFWEFQL